MIFGLEKPDQFSVFQPAERLPSTFGERFSAGFQQEWVSESSRGLARSGVEREIYDQIAEAIGSDGFDPPQPAPVPITDPYGHTDYSTGLGPFETHGDRALTWDNYWAGTMPPDMFAPNMFAAVSTARQSDPDAYPGLPASQQEFEDMVRERQQERLAEAMDVMAHAPEGSWGAELTGMLSATAVDPLTVATLPISLGAGSVARVAATGAALGFGTELAALPHAEANAEFLGIDDPDVGQRLALGALAGGGLAGAIYGAPRALSYGRDFTMAGWDRLSARRAARAEADGAPPEATIRDDTARALTPTPMEEERLIQRAAQDIEAGTVTSDYIPPGAPPNWVRIRNGIFAGESGGDYNALYGFSNRPGGPFSDVRITEMTVDEAIAFSNTRGRYARWVADRNGGVIATPMGAYQVVGSTLARAKQGLGLTGREIMTPELQDRIGVWIYHDQGTRAWVGYRGPQDNFTPSGGSDYAGSPGITRRSYTGDGQLRYGDDARIDIEYQVVDARMLHQAAGDLQPRDRSHVRSDLWVAQTAARLDPPLMTFSPTADRGAPVVGPDNIIESGNGRVQVLRRAYAEHPDRAAAYRAEIEAAGFTIPEGVDEPVLIARRRTEFTPEQRREFVVAAQDSGVAQMTAAERAQVGQQALTAETMALYRPGERLNAPANQDFARRFVDAFPPSQQGQFISSDKGLSTDGIRQLRDAIFARAYDDQVLLRRFIEEDAGELKSLLDALSQASPDMALLRAHVEAGLVRADMDITPNVLDATRLIMDARDIAAREGKSVAGMLEELLDLTDMLDGRISPLTQAMVRWMVPDGRQRPAKEIGDFLSKYAREAMVAGRTGDAFADAVGPLDILKKLDGKAFGHLTETGNPRPRLEPVIRTDNAALTGFDEGAASPAAIQSDEIMLREAKAQLADITPEPEGTARVEALERLRGELGDLEFTTRDGTVIRPADLIDEIEADDVLMTVLDTCVRRG